MNFLVKNNKMRLHLNWVLSLSAVSAILTGCGGVVGETGTGNGAGGSADTGSYTLSQPERLSSEPIKGAPSLTLPLSDYGTATLTFPEETTDSTKYLATTTPLIPFGEKAHLSDVGTQAAWAAGWTGQDTLISIIDDFKNSPITSTVILEPVPRKKMVADTSGAYTATYDVFYQVTNRISHGDLVMAIAGGGFRSPKISKQLTLSVDTDKNLTACTVTRPPTDASFYTCSGSFYDGGATSIRATMNAQPVVGVAGEAFVIDHPVDLSSSQDPLKTVATIHGHLINSTQSKEVDVINFSLGSEIPTSNLSRDQVMAQIQSTPLKDPINTVITVAAGNGGAPCAADNLSGCNAMAVSLAFQPQTKASTIVVGALTGTGQNQKIATYSTRAGILKDRFILASGDTGFYPDVFGTSFAAPRVAGVAAILKQKYPALTSAQIASIILLSANKDINNDGKPDFVGVDPIFGHGKLDLDNALRLAGAR